MKYVYAVLSILIPFVVILIHNEFHFFLNYMFETRQEKSKLFPFEVNNNQSSAIAEIFPMLHLNKTNSSNQLMRIFSSQTHDVNTSLSKKNNSTGHMSSEFKKNNPIHHFKYDVIFLGDSNMKRLLTRYIAIQKFSCQQNMNRCGYDQYFLSLQNTKRRNPSWIKPRYGIEGPVFYGLANPGCSDCSGCNSVECTSLLSNPKTKLSYIPIEFARDVMLQSKQYDFNSTQEVISEYLKHRPAKWCVVNSGLHDMLIPGISDAQYIENVIYYLNNLKSCFRIIWLHTSSVGIGHSLYGPTANTRIRSWNSLLHNNDMFLKIVHSQIDLYNVSLKAKREDHVHFGQEYYDYVASILYKEMIDNSTTIVVSDPFKVQICGYNFSILAGYLFPNKKITQWDYMASSSHYNDVLITSGTCNKASSYRGKILYVDGESGKMPIPYHPRTFYIGVTRPPRNVMGNIQVFHMAHTTLFHSYSAHDFIQPRNNTLKENFLVYIATNCVNFRENAFDNFVKLAKENEFQLPRALGGCYGKHRELKFFKTGRNNRMRNVDILKQYKFALVMENTNVDGYVSEKIADAFMAGTIPIYYGTHDIFKIFNRNAFVFYDIKQAQFAIDQVEYLTKNHTEYENMIKEPILVDSQNTLRKYFSLLDTVGGGHLKNRIRRMLGFQP